MAECKMPYAVAIPAYRMTPNDTMTTCNERDEHATYDVEPWTHFLGLAVGSYDVYVVDCEEMYAYPHGEERPYAFPSFA